jgi:hypothetical protein
MAGNFLEAFAPFMQGPVGGSRPMPSAIPMIDPNTGLPIQEPILDGQAPAQVPQQRNFDEAFAPFMQTSQAPSGPADLLESTPYSAEAMASPAPEQAQSPAAEAPRKRRSLLETVGQLADVIARVGGADALYQPTLDAQQDRVRLMEMQDLQRQIQEQNFQKGGIEIANDERSRLAGALAAVAGNPDAAALWPQIAEQAGIDPQKAAAIGVMIERNPDVTGTLAQSLGFTPERQGSRPKEEAIYEMLMNEDPALAKSYLQSLANPDSMNPYQAGMLELALARLGFDQARFERTEARESDEAAARAAGGVDLTPKQRGDVRMKLELLPNAKRQYERVKQLHEQMMEDGTFARGGVAGLLPGQVAGGRAEEFDKAVGALRKSILSMTRVPGVGSMSNYETALDEQALPSRWGSDEGRTEAITNIGLLLDNYESGYREMLGPEKPRSASRPARRQSSGRGSGGAQPAPTRRSMSPAAVEARRRGLID